MADEGICPIFTISTQTSFPGSKQIIKLFLHLACLFVWHLATTKHNLRARHVLSDLARANYGTSVVAECNAWSAGKSTKAARLQLCAPVTKVRKRGGRPQPPASEKPGITATLTEQSQDPTCLPTWLFYLIATITIHRYRLRTYVSAAHILFNRSWHGHHSSPWI